MEYEQLKLLLERINGCTFATMDTTTKEPSTGTRKVTTGMRVLMFTNKKVSGYEQMVRRRLVEAGKNPDDFVLSDLPWGERIPNTPVITCRGDYYLQTIVLQPGQSRHYIGDREVSVDGLISRRRTNQGLPEGNEVVVRTFNLKNIDAIRLMGETVVAERGTILPIGG